MMWRDVVIVIVDETAAVAGVFVEALFGRAVIDVRFEVPFAEERGLVADAFECLRDGDLLEKHIAVFVGRIRIGLGSV